MYTFQGIRYFRNLRVDPTGDPHNMIYLNLDNTSFPSQEQFAEEHMSKMNSGKVMPYY